MLEWKRVIDLPHCAVTLESLVDILFNVLSSSEIEELIEELQARIKPVDGSELADLEMDEA